MKSRKSTVCSKLYAKSYSSSSCRNTIVNKSTKVNHCDVMKKNASLRVMIDDKDCIHFSVLQISIRKLGLDIIFSLKKIPDEDFQCSVSEVFC